MEQYELQAGYSLKGLSLLVKYVSRMPGQRSIILVTHRVSCQRKLQLPEVDNIIDLALALADGHQFHGSEGFGNAGYHG